jgi:hypothetical protein
MKASGSALHEPAAVRGPAQDWKSCEAIEPFGERTDVIGEPGDFIRVHLVADGLGDEVAYVTPPRPLQTGFVTRIAANVA